MSKAKKAEVYFVTINQNGKVIGRGAKKPSREEAMADAQGRAKPNAVVGYALALVFNNGRLVDEEAVVF